jgi:hypothetical protein
MILQRILYDPLLSASHFINLFVNHVQKLLYALARHTADGRVILATRKELFPLRLTQQINLVPHFDHVPRRKRFFEMQFFQDL